MGKTWKDFMLESNRIEGENKINPGDKEAITIASLNGIDSLDMILAVHKALGDYLNKDWVGRWRKVNVVVGHYKPPSPDKIPMLMKEFIDKLYLMDAWTAHNEFEKIHPFRDLNGRVGRLIWLNKMGCIPGIPFLQLYYYQTLEKYEDNKEGKSK